MGRDEERTEQIDIEALRRSLADSVGQPRAAGDAPAVANATIDELESEDLIEEIHELEELEPIELFDLAPSQPIAPSEGRIPVGSMSLSVPVVFDVFDAPVRPKLASIEIDVADFARTQDGQDDLGRTAPHYAPATTVTAETPMAHTFPDPEELPEAPLPSFPLFPPEEASAEGGHSAPLDPAPLDPAPLDPTPNVPFAGVTAAETDVIDIVPADDVAMIASVEADVAGELTLDAEEQEHHQSGAFGSLVALYRERIANTRHPRERVSILLKQADVYETKLGDRSAAFDTLVAAFDLAPDNPTVVAAIDRLGKETDRIGELAEKVRRELLPKSPDERRVVLLTHIVYWYERVLGRGREVAGFVAEISRYDKNHPILLKRAAQLAELNGDVKGQREHLARALARTTRSDERLALLLALASAHAGTSEELKHYEAAVEANPESFVALQALTRVAKEKNKYDLVRWALQRQTEVATGSDERVVVLLDLAALEETKFLKRDIAATLLERVLKIDPIHPAALEGLERCYRALREWTKLLDVLAARAEQATEKRSKIELLELAAEVHESKLGDLEGATRVYRSLLLVEPKHRRALADLARIYEKLGDWANVATYKAEVAELAPTPRAASHEFVKLGDFLSAPERDPDAARRQYERAIVVDPTNAAAWDALQKVAAATGDILRIVEYLEERAKLTDVPRQRANVFVEIAKVHRERGDENRARIAFEQATIADPSNEIAAVAMLDVYTEQRRWAEAAPLCELLVNAAIRDRDADTLFARLRLVTRIAAALGDAERAISAAVVALEARPEDVTARADLITIAHDYRETVAALERARPHLLRIAESPADLPAEQLARLATLQTQFGELDGAVATLERVRVLAPDDQETTKTLAELYLGQGDFARACKLKVGLGRSAPSDDARFAILCEVGEIWARRAEELETAASVFAEARKLKPLDPGLLQTLMWLYGELGRWDQLSGVLEDLSKVQENHGDRVDSLLAMARVARDKLGDRLRAADSYDLVLDQNRKRLDVFEELVRALTEEKAWERLELAYRRMVERVRQDDEPHLQFLLAHQIGLIYRDRLGDAARAFDALEEAARLRPDHVEVRRSLTELLVVTDNLDNAVLRMREQIHLRPHEPELYEELYELFLRQHAFDKAWCAIDVLARLGKLNAEQRRFHDDYAPMALDRVPGQIVEEAWRSHLQEESLEPRLTTIFALIAIPFARMRANQVRPDQRVARPFTTNHSRLHDLIRTTFDDAAEILALPSPELLLGDAKAATPFSAAYVQAGAVLVSASAAEARARSLPYLVGKCLAEQRPNFLIRSLVPSVTELTSVLHTAMRVSRQEPPDDGAGASLDQTFAAALSVQEAASLRGALAHTSSESSFNVESWARAADLSTMRAGLLIAGTVEQAAQTIMAETSATGSLVPREKLGELYKFATSDLYSDLRVATGVAVQG